MRPRLLNCLQVKDLRAIGHMYFLLAITNEIVLHDVNVSICEIRSTEKGAKCRNICNEKLRFDKASHFRGEKLTYIGITVQTR